MIEFTPINGKTQNISTKKILEILPFSTVASSLNEEFLLQHPSFLCQEKTITHTKTFFNDEIIDDSEKSSTTDISIQPQEFIDSYKSSGVLPKKSYLYYISEDDMKAIYKQGFFNRQVDFFEKTKFNPDIVDDQKYCLVKFLEIAGRYIIQTEDNRFFTEPVYISNHLTTSSYWELDPLLEHLIKNKQFKFIISHDRNTKIADLNDEKHLGLLITSTPYYNQNDDNDQEEFSSIYIFNNDEIQAMIKNPESWIKDLYPIQDEHLNSTEFDSLFYQEHEHIIAFAANGFQFKKNYIEAVAEKTAKQLDKPARRFRNN